MCDLSKVGPGHMWISTIHHWDNSSTMVEKTIQTTCTEILTSSRKHLKFSLIEFLLFPSPDYSSCVPAHNCFHSGFWNTDFILVWVHFPFSNVKCPGVKVFAFISSNTFTCPNTGFLYRSFKFMYVKYNLITSKLISEFLKVSPFSVLGVIIYIKHAFGVISWPTFKNSE